LYSVGGKGSDYSLHHCAQTSLGPKKSSIQWGMKKSAQIQWLDSKDDKSALFRNTAALLPLPKYLHFIMLKFLKNV
jgi:hypothetical protein